MFINTPTSRVGSGFMVGDGNYIVTSSDLISDANVITIRFPNEDSIKAKIINSNPINNIAILKLINPPKTQRTPMLYSNNNYYNRKNYVFTYGYPWTNTRQDKYRLIEGSLISSIKMTDNLIRFEMPLDSIHRGNPLLNAQGEIIGMILTVQNKFGKNKISKFFHQAINVSVLKQELGKQNLYDRHSSNPIHTIPENSKYIEEIKNNIVLIEAN
tara:strand:- start:208 stop:849 length:642 start_codon:yes stop_codon:yes gene_type:complete